MPSQFSALHYMQSRGKKPTYILRRRRYHFSLLLSLRSTAVQDFTSTVEHGRLRTLVSKNSTSCWMSQKLAVL